MPVDPREAARLSVRPLLPGSPDVLRDEALRLGTGIEGLPRLATHGAVEAFALRGLAPDETRVLEREAAALGLAVLRDRAGRRALLLGPLQSVAELPWRLISFGQRTEPLGLAIADALAANGSRSPGWRIGGGRTLPNHERTVVMGIVNVTPDSFSGDGIPDLDAAVAHGEALAAAGADIVDVGGESTRPHSTSVDVDVEMERVLPVVRRLAERLSIPVSVDTRRAAVARAAIEAGAAIVNDIWGLRGDPGMAAVCAESDVGVVLMHNQRGTEYTELLEDVATGLRESVAAAAAAGIDTERLVVDPGIGFGKTPAQNLEVLRRLGELRGIGRPLLVGPSRKSTIGLLLREPDGSPAPHDRRLEGTLVLCALAVERGADIVRVHDVEAAVRAMRVTDALVRGTPASLRHVPAPGPTG